MCMDESQVQSLTDTVNRHNLQNKVFNIISRKCRETMECLSGTRVVVKNTLTDEFYSTVPTSQQFKLPAGVSAVLSYRPETKGRDRVSGTVRFIITFANETHRDMRDLSITVGTVDDGHFTISPLRSNRPDNVSAKKVMAMVARYRKVKEETGRLYQEIEKAGVSVYDACHRLC